MTPIDTEQKAALSALLAKVLTLSLTSTIPVHNRLELAQLSGKLQLMLEFDDVSMVNSSMYAIINGQKIIAEHLNLIN